MLCALMECLCQCSFSWKKTNFHAPAPLFNVNHSVGRGDEWEIGLKSMFLIQIEMLGRQNHIKWGWKEPQKPTPSPCWSFPIMLNYLHLKTYQRRCSALWWCPLEDTHQKLCFSMLPQCEPVPWTEPQLHRKLPAWWPVHRLVHPAAQTHAPIRTECHAVSVPWRWDTNRFLSNLAVEVAVETL